jgi:hypothetical protein
VKIEFRPDFHLGLKLEVLWPKLKGAFKGMNILKGLALKPVGYARLSRKLLLLLSWIAAAILVLVIVLKVL